MTTEARVEKGKVVSIEYVLTDPNGKELDRAGEDSPLMFLADAKNIVPGLDEALIGLAVGDTKDVVVPPEKGYGPKRGLKPQRILRSKFPAEAQLEVGAQFVMSSPEGPFPIWVSKVQGREVHITPEHPLAGQTLHFAVKVTAIRDATEEEVAHGHPHGPGGHHHHDDGDHDHGHGHDDHDHD